MTQISTDFGNLTHEPMPLDAYAQLFLNAESDDFTDTLIELNSGWLYDIDDSIYEDRHAFQAAVLPYFDFAYSRTYRHLRLMNHHDSAQQNQAKIAMVQGLLGSLSEKTYLAHSSEVARLTHAAFLYDKTMRPTNAMAAAMGLDSEPQTNLNSFYVENLGAWGTNMIRRSNLMAETAYTISCELLSEWNKHTGWGFNLRHPVAFSAVTQYDSAWRTGFPLLNGMRLAGQGPQAVFNALRTLVPESMYSPSDGNWRYVFDAWRTRVCTAYFYRGVFEWQLNPRNIPPVLLAPHSHTLPVILDSESTAGHEDVWHLIHNYRIADILTTVPAPDFESVQLPQAILDLGWLNAMCATIISMNQPSGRGSHRPRWIHSPINAAIVEFSMKVAASILHSATEELERASS